MSDKKKGEEIPGTVGERPDDAHAGTQTGGFHEGPDDAPDTQDADTPPQETPPAKPEKGGVIEGGKGGE